MNLKCELVSAIPCFFQRRIIQNVIKSNGLGIRFLCLKNIIMICHSQRDIKSSDANLRWKLQACGWKKKPLTKYRRKKKFARLHVNFYFENGQKGCLFLVTFQKTCLPWQCTDRCHIEKWEFYLATSEIFVMSCKPKKKKKKKTRKDFVGVKICHWIWYFSMNMFCK